MVLHLRSDIFAVSQEAGERLTGPEEGEGGDSAAGDGEFNPTDPDGSSLKPLPAFLPRHFLCSSVSRSIWSASRVTTD